MERQEDHARRHTFTEPRPRLHLAAPTVDDDRAVILQSNRLRIDGVDLHITALVRPIKPLAAARHRARVVMVQYPPRRQRQRILIVG